MPVCDALYDLLRYRFRVRNIHDNRVYNVGKQGFQKGWNAQGKGVTNKIELIVEAHGDVAHAPLGQCSDTVQTHPQWYAEAIS